VTIGALLIIFGISTGVMAHSFRSAPKAKTAGPSINLLDQEWGFLSSATAAENALSITATDAKIVNQDGSGGQTNPPINLYGTHLKASGDFAVTARMSAPTNGTATLRLYDKPPIIADEFRLEPASLALTLQQTKLGVQLWSGSQRTANSPRPSLSQQLTLPDDTADITVSRIGKDLVIQAGQSDITFRGRGSLFRSGNVWFGLDTTGDNFSLTKLAANGINGSSVSAVDTTDLHGSLSTDGLQALASKIRPDFHVGTAVALGPLVSDNDYAQQLFQNFGNITLENAMKPQFISPKQGVYTFQDADALIAIAHGNNMTVHGHTLAFSEANPAWMRALPTKTEADRQATTTILLDYVSHVMTHFKGQFDSLDVINEPLDPDQGPDLQQNIWYKAMGPDYMVRVSKLVHEIDPDVKQYVNENGAEMAGERQDALLGLIQGINKKGGFISGVGLQAHVYDMSTDAIDGAALNDTFNRFAKANLTVRISENDVTDDDGTAAQAGQYATVFAACLRNSNCVSYSTWGFNDRYDWFIDDDGSAQQGHDLLFDGTSATPAYDALRKLMQ
jgi:endo-1,4-beta-xylanase